MKSMSIGNTVGAYLKGYGYVGIGSVSGKAVGPYQFRYNKKSVAYLKQAEHGIFKNYDNEKTDQLVKVKCSNPFQEKKLNEN